jgi:hypothetical protein
MKKADELSRRQKNIVRNVARQALRECRGDQDKARLLVEERLQRELGSVFVTIAIKLAIELIIYWLKNRTTDPGAVFQAGEPGANDDDAEEYGIA